MKDSACFAPIHTDAFLRILRNFEEHLFFTEHLLQTASGLCRNLRIYLYLQKFAYWLFSLTYFPQDALKIFWLKGEMDSIFSNSFLNVSYISHYTMVFFVNFAKCFIENTWSTYKTPFSVSITTKTFYQ